MAGEPDDKSCAGPEVAAAQALEAAPRDERAVEVQVISSFHAGPLPDPQTLLAYAKLIPNGAERIMSLVEREAAHRHEQDADKTRQIARDHLTAFALTTGLSGAGLYLGVTGHDWLAAGLFTTTIGAVVTSFVFDGKARADDDKKSSRGAVSPEGGKNG